jgi:hypothetical protein
MLRWAVSRGSRAAAAWGSSPSSAATVTGSRPSLCSRITRSMMLRQPELRLSPYLAKTGNATLLDGQKWQLQGFILRG